MKSRNTPDDQSRFNGPLRHYHRAGTKPQKTWDEWVDGASSKTGSSKGRWKIVGITIAILALMGIIAGLIVELS
jgi:hypothetical protein